MILTRTIQTGHKPIDLTEGSGSHAVTLVYLRNLSNHDVWVSSEDLPHEDLNRENAIIVPREARLPTMDLGPTDKLYVTSFIEGPVEIEYVLTFSA